MMVQFDVFTRLLYIGLWTAADDHGAIRDEPDRIAMEVMPREDPEMVKLNIDLLIASGRLSRMLNDDGTSYLMIEKWTDHQRVDKPSKSKIIRENSRKLAIPAESRRKVALKYGCTPGDKHEATCYFCGNPGSIYWPRLYSGKAGSWVAFSELELDHFEPESIGGENSSENLVLSCRNCNRARCNKTAFDFVTAKLSVTTRESSGGFQGGKEGKGSGNGKEELSLAGVRESIPPPENPNPDANNAILNNRLPPGGFGAFGKFPMCDDWQPDPDFLQKAAVRGVILTEPVKPHELAEFIAYWQPEGKAFHHTQWETKLAQSIQFSRNKNAEVNHVQTGRRDSQRPDYKGSAVEAVHAATAELRRQYGCEGDDAGDAYLGSDGGAVFGQVDSTERGEAIITLDQRDWETH